MFVFLPLLLGAVSAGTVGVVTRALTKAVIVRGIKEVVNDNNKK